MKFIHPPGALIPVHIKDTAELHADAMIKSADLDLPNNLRHDLTRKWGNHSQYVNRHRPCVLFIGHNPSTADYKYDDPTVREWYHFTQLWGYDKYVAMNLYPYRSSHPQEVEEWMKGEGQHSPEQIAHFMTRNQDRIAEQAAHADLIVPCWGNIDGPGKQDVIKLTLETIHKARGRTTPLTLFCFGITNSGAPMHPLARGASRPARDMNPLVWKQI